MSNKIKNLFGAALGFSFVAAMATVNILDFTQNGPRADRIKGELVAEMTLLEAPPQSQLYHKSSSSKPGQALVKMTYSTTLDYLPIRAHYDAELISHGWKNLSEEHFRWGIQRCYSKGDYRAVLFYNEGIRDETFTISMSWGLGLCG